MVSETKGGRYNPGMLNMDAPRRGFLRRFAGFAGLSAASAAGAAKAAPVALGIPAYARAQEYRSLKQSSFDTTGGNRDYWPVRPGETKEVFRSAGPGVITHIWFTWASKSPMALKEMVLRIYWDGHDKPSVETPLGDFFGLNLGEFFIYQSAFLDCAPNRGLNAWFAMPFRKEARITVTNEGALEVGALYSNIDYQTSATIPADSLYFHAQYRQAAPNEAVAYPGGKELNPDGEKNYLFADIRGRGHLLGVTLGVLQNTDKWMGEGDEMIFVDGEGAARDQWDWVGRLFPRGLRFWRPGQGGSVRVSVSRGSIHCDGRESGRKVLRVPVACG